MFEELAVLFEKLGQMLAAIGLIAGKENLMMGPLDGRYAVDLHETHVVKSIAAKPSLQAPMRRGREPCWRERCAGIAIGKANRHEQRVGFYSKFQT